MIPSRHIALLLVLTGAMSTLMGQDHPSLILTQKGAGAIKQQLGKLPLLDQSIRQLQAEVDREMGRGIQVPVPKDLAGGYSHEQHKRNFFTLQKAGALYQITGEVRYAEFTRDVLRAYAQLFPQVDRHPATRSYARGKFFWQCLNDANWMVYVSQAYDCIYDWLDPKEREKLNREFFRPYADFLSVETPQFFNRIHNHSTWGNAAVGMIGLVMDDEELVQRALYGSGHQVPADRVQDNDGGLIQLPGQAKAGFLAQIDEAFSPNGYYTEGPYYQRYAMYPFLVFAQALQNKRPSLKIFDYRQGVLLEAVHALLNQANSAGEFFPFNDAQKGMSFLSRELVAAVNIAYHFGEQDPSLLSIVEKQGKVPLDDTGLSTASALAAGKATPFHRQSMELTDGAKGTEGGIGILRSPNTDTDLCVVMKYSKHGMGHGHFDKLSISMYHDEAEVYQDYGSARWVNIEQKDGGGYLKENTTWAKQTIAHNTVIVDQKSQFEGNVRQADLHHSSPYIFDVSDKAAQVMSAKEDSAYPGVALHRTIALIESDHFENPVVLDLFRVTADDTHESYDLPYYFHGEVMKTNFLIEQSPGFESLATDHGYQHLGVEATGVPKDDNVMLNWFYKNRFYTLTTVASGTDQLIFGRVGKSDPLFNLRRDPVFIQRVKDKQDVIFVSTTECHGQYSPVTEIASNAYGQVKEIKILKNNDQYSIVQVEVKTGESMVFALSNNNSLATTQHKVQVGKEEIAWSGPFTLIHHKLIN